MKEIVCPNCHKTVTVNESSGASNVKQVEDASNSRSSRCENMIGILNMLKQQNTANEKKASPSELSKNGVVLTKNESKNAQHKSKLDFVVDKVKTELSRTVADKEEIAKLQSAIQELDNKINHILIEEQDKAQEIIRLKNAEITNLQLAAELIKKEAAINENNIKEQYEQKLKIANEQVEYYKNLNSRV
ncbi:MAG: hypothetical protein KBT04_07935 [Bacteroidales bacterium]|nr:hypothetical protein [Candidatus Colimorpha onthohippi]